MKKNKVLFLSNYPKGYVLSSRAEFFAEALGRSFKYKISYRKNTWPQNFLNNIKTIYKFKPSLIYTMEGFSCELAAYFYYLIFNTPYIIDRANTAEDHFREIGSSFIFLKLIIFFERKLLKNAKAIICRGINQTLVFRARFYNKNIYHCSEGTDLNKWYPKKSLNLKKKFNTSNFLTFGTIGNATWNVNNHFFGRETIEILRLLPNLKIKGIILPSVTSNLAALKELESLAIKYNVYDKLLIIKDIPRKKVSDYLGIIDVCISTQLKTLSGEMRTTAKLPDYMACGKYILCNDIGDARFYLPPEMLIDSNHNYYKLLSNRILQIYKNKSVLKHGLQGIKTAEKFFKYRKIALSASKIIKNIIDEHCRESL